MRPEGGAESGAQLDLDPDLARILAAWPNLSEPIRALVGTVVVN